MQKDQGISLPYNVKNAGDITGKFDPKLPNILFDVFYMRLFQRRTALRQKFDLSKRFRLVLCRERIQKFCYDFFSIRSRV